MSNYKFQDQTATKIEGNQYRVTLSDGRFYFVPDWYIEDPKNGWEKVGPFKEGSWYYFETGRLKLVVRYTMVEDNKFFYSEAYGIGHDDRGLCWADDWCVIRFIKGPATLEQMELCLGHVARHKGYKEGVFLKSLAPVSHEIKIGKGYSRNELSFVYDKGADQLVYGGCCIYSKGTWATILPKKKPKKAEVGDWKTAKVFSYDDLFALDLTDSISMYGRKVLIISEEELEEEAKKRTNA